MKSTKSNVKTVAVILINVLFI